jgi:hypothetical protein
VASGASAVIGTAVTSCCDFSLGSTEGDNDFLDDFLTARLRGDFGSIAILNSFSTNRKPVRISRGSTISARFRLLTSPNKTYGFSSPQAR